MFSLLPASFAQLPMQPASDLNGRLVLALLALTPHPHGPLGVWNFIHGREHVPSAFLSSEIETASRRGRFRQPKYGPGRI